MSPGRDGPAGRYHPDMLVPAELRPRHHRWLTELTSIPTAAGREARVVEAVHFQKFSESGPFGNRRVAQTRQHVEMSSVDGEWVVSDLSEEATEVKDLSSVAADAP